MLRNKIVNMMWWKARWSCILFVRVAEQLSISKVLPQEDKVLKNMLTSRDAGSS